MCNNCNGNSSLSLYPTQTWDGNAPYVGCCKVDEGYYCIWDDNDIALSCEDWADLCDVRNVLRQVSHIAFDVVSDRQRARTALNNLKRDAPFGMCKRFPLGKMFVNLSCSVYAALFQRLLGSLDNKDRESEKSMKFRASDDIGHSLRTDYSSDDAKTAFRNTMIVLENELCKRNETYSRWTFEKKYDLKWCVGPCPSPEFGGAPSNPPETPKPPEKPPATPTPNPPVPKKKFGEMMDKLREKGLDPGSFSVFTDDDIAKGDFQCDRTTRRLQNAMINRDIPEGATKIYVFTPGEYMKCGKEQATQGYIYYPNNGVISSELKLEPGKFKKLEFDQFVNGLDVEAILHRLYEKSVGTKKWSNSKMKSVQISEEDVLSEISFEDNFAESSEVAVNSE